MNTITADAAMLAVLQQTNGLTEIRDGQGNVIGFFAPVSVDRAHLYAQAAASISPAEVKQRKDENGETHTTPEVLEHLDWEELHRRAQSTGGRTLREIFQRMQSLTPDESVRARLQKQIDQMAEEGCATR